MLFTTASACFGMRQKKRSPRVHAKETREDKQSQFNNNNEKKQKPSDQKAAIHKACEEARKNVYLVFIIS